MAERDGRARSAAKRPRDEAAELRARLRRSELLVALTRRLGEPDDLDRLLERLVEIVSQEADAERASLFLNDPITNELYARVAQGELRREIRIPNDAGIAGAVFQSGRGEVVHDAYADPRFERTVDQLTAYTTRSILCAPIRNGAGTVIGVAQALNKRRGRFTPGDLELLEAMATQASVALQSSQFIERTKRTRQKEMEFLDLVADITSSLDLSLLLRRVMSEATRMLNAERSTLFLHNAKTKELWSEVGEGLGTLQIRIPDHVGIAGAVFQTGGTINIPHAYADLRFDPATDKRTGFFTRSILCVPVVNKSGRTIGVTQALNKKGGPFTAEDERRLAAFTAQVSIALENASLFEDVQNMRNYNQSVLESMTNGVITLDEESRVRTCNAAGLRILRTTEAGVVERPAAEVFAGANAWILERVAKVGESGMTDVAMDAQMTVAGECIDVNVTVQPLVGLKSAPLGTMVLVEDISTEKRMRSTMSRYMDPAIADQVLAAGSEALGGQSVEATVLFTDIRDFTPLTEELGPQATVQLLNDYFSLMVGCIQREGGMLDKFIGDAIMAEFGIPMARDDDADRAVRAAVGMLRELAKHNEERRARGQRPIRMGVGMATDQIVSGNIGSPKRMDYTVIGDAANVASRLEGACKEYGAQILCSESTYRRLKGTYRARELDKLIVKGKVEPVTVYEILEHHTDQTFPHMTEALGFFRDGLRAYRSGEFEKAAAAFREALALHPKDRASEVFLQRCEYLEEHVGEDAWNGVWVMKTK